MHISIWRRRLASHSRCGDASRRRGLCAPGAGRGGARRPEAPHHVWIAAALVALAVNAMLEVHLLNIGFPLGVAFMLLLMEREGVADEPRLSARPSGAGDRWSSRQSRPPSS